MPIENGFLVACSYYLYNEEENLENILERASEDAPFTFIVGMGIALPAFEEKLMGLNEGDKFDFLIQPQEAFGEYREELIMNLNRSIFTNADGEFDSENIFEGNTIPMRTADGQVVHGLVNKIGEEQIEVDFNHPYAGVALRFVGKIETARLATEEDQARIYAQLNGGGCGGGCGSCHEEDHCGNGCSCGH